MKRLAGRPRLVAALAGAVCVAVALSLLLSLGRGASMPLNATGPRTLPTPAPVQSEDAAARVVDILTQMHQKAFNPDAPAPKNSGGVMGGLFINWSATWDGDLATAGENTNFQTDGRTDSEIGSGTRHDEFTDLLYLRNLLGYRAAHPGDHRFDSDIARMEPIVRSDFQGYTYYKCSLYSELEDMAGFDPGGGWASTADSYARAVYNQFYDHTLGTVVDTNGTYRVDYATECAVAFTETGMRQHDPAMEAAGISTAQHVIQDDVDPDTRLLPLQVVAARTGLDSVVQQQVKMGEEAQTLDALLTMYDLTHDGGYLRAVQQAVTWMYASPLYDRSNGGFFFAIDYGGSGLESGYKESRQAWMLALLEHLERLEPGRWMAQADAMLSVVKDRLWGAASDGYLYRVTPQFTVYVNHDGPGHTKVSESWVTTEAMDIACQVLEGVGNS